MKNRCPVCLGLLIKDIPDDKGRCHACQCVKAAAEAGGEAGGMRMTTIIFYTCAIFLSVFALSIYGSMTVCITVLTVTEKRWPLLPLVLVLWAVVLVICKTSFDAMLAFMQ